MKFKILISSRVITYLEKLYKNKRHVKKIKRYNQSKEEKHKLLVCVY